MSSRKETTYEKDFDTVSLNGTFISKRGVKPLEYAYADKSYDGLKILADQKGKLVYDLDLKQQGIMSIRIKPIHGLSVGRTILMHQMEGVNVLGAVLEPDNKVRMIINHQRIENESIQILDNQWSTVILRWDFPKCQLMVNGEVITKVSGVTTTYELNGDKMIAEKINQQVVNYVYNERDLLVEFEYQKKYYYYIRDLLGIITEIVDENGQVVVSNKYDSWGNIVYKQVSNEIIDQINHFVYKGYYLDNETGWYYLKTRYYDPSMGRFINADHHQYLESGSFFRTNLHIVRIIQ